MRFLPSIYPAIFHLLLESFFITMSIKEFGWNFFYTYLLSLTHSYSILSPPPPFFSSFRPIEHISFKCIWENSYLDVQNSRRCSKFKACSSITIRKRKHVVIRLNQNVETFYIVTTLKIIKHDCGNCTLMWKKWNNSTATTTYFEAVGLFLWQKNQTNSIQPIFVIWTI